MTPQSPLAPCTEIAPTTSSSFSTRSTYSHDRQTSTPAMRPMTTDAIGLTKPLGAVIATRPARNPLPVIDASGLPYRSHMEYTAENDHAMPASIVLPATELMRRLPLADAPRVEPGLNPNQPNA